MGKVGQATEQKRALARSRSFKLQSPTYRKIAKCLLSLPPPVLKTLMTEYIGYSLVRFVDLSVQSSKNYIVFGAEVLTISGLNWADSGVPDDCVLEDVAVFEVE